MEEYYCNALICKVVKYRWKVSCNKLKVYTINPKATTEITKQKGCMIS